MTKPKQWELKTQGITLAVWKDGEVSCSLAFPKDFWQDGIIILGGLPFKVTKWIKLYYGGRLQWIAKVGEEIGAAKWGGIKH